jgi:hypothetical protein
MMPWAASCFGRVSQMLGLLVIDVIHDSRLFSHGSSGTFGYRVRQTVCYTRKFLSAVSSPAFQLRQTVASSFGIDGREIARPFSTPTCPRYELDDSNFQR